MPRFPTKSQAERHGRGSSTQASSPPAQEVVEEDIVPSNSAQAQWADMLVREDADEAVGEIMDELMSMVIEGCYKVYIETQLEGFTASWAKNYLTQEVEHQFICLDKGEELEETPGMEDSEPLPSTLNPWAKCVSIVKATPAPQLPPQQVTEPSHVPLKKESKVSHQNNVVTLQNNSPRQADRETIPTSPVGLDRCKMLSPCPPPKTERKKREWLIVPPKNAPRKLFPALPSPPERKVFETKSQNLQDLVVSYQSKSLCHHQDSKPILKPDPLYFPRRIISPEYEIVEDNHTHVNSNNMRGQSRLVQRYNKQRPEWMVTSLKSLTSSLSDEKKFQKRKEADIDLIRSLPSTHRSKSMAPPRLDSIVLCKEVSLLDQQAAEVKPQTLNHSSLSTKLRPIHTKANLPLLSVDEVISGSSPQVIPLHQSKNS